MKPSLFAYPAGNTSPSLDPEQVHVHLLTTFFHQEILDLCPLNPERLFLQGGTSGYEKEYLYPAGTGTFMVR